ncbi:MAG: helix-turn-helix domain-containing protein [Alphaproteobacteria bacterium]|nr:MAG: helix-turn-helix domain-containing protein [Alphaproteobacteria bacterium]
MALSEVEDRFEEAARTLRRLPDPPGSGPKGYGPSWPEYIHEARHAYGYNDATMKIVPSAAEIARMEECISWLFLLDPVDAKIIWMRAEGHRWRRVCIQVGLVRQTAWRRWVAALQTVTNRLNGCKSRAKPVKPAKTSKKP